MVNGFLVSQRILRALHTQSMIRHNCHHLEQGGNKLSGRCSLLTPAAPPAKNGKGGKGRETYKLNIKTALLVTLIIPTILIIRGIK